MKRIVALFLVFTLVFSFVACSNDETIVDNDSTTNPSIITNDYKTSYEMTGNLYDYQIIIDEVVYQFPMTVEEILKCGWEFVSIDSQTTMLEAGCLSYYSMNSKFDTIITFYIANFSRSNQLVKDCYAVGVSINTPTEYENITVDFGNDISFGKSTEEDIVLVYGAPTEATEAEEYKYLVYEENVVNNNVEFTLKNGSLHEVSMINVEEPSDFVDDDPSNESVNIDYEQPTSLGNDIKSGIFELDGVLYKMPVPVSELEKNGWVIDIEETEESISAGDYVYAVLRKDNAVLEDIKIRNTTDKEIYTKNGVVVGIESFDVKGAEIKLPGNIVAGMSREDAFNKFGNQEYEKLEYSSDKYCFTIDEENYIYINIAFEDEKVDYFSLNF